MQTYGVAGNYYGVTHPSQPNYIASTAGTTAGVPDDNNVTVDLPNIVDSKQPSLPDPPTAHAELSAASP